MAQKLLKFFLIGRVQEYYFINVTIVTLIFFVFHLEGLKSWTLYDDEPTKAIFSVAILSLMFILVSWGLIKNKDHNFLSGRLEIITFVPLIGLTTVSLMALLFSLRTKDNLLEITITSLLLLKYSIKFLILNTYSFLSKYNYIHNRVYKSIKERLESAVGNYQTNAQEVMILVVVTLFTIFLLTKTAMNPFTQYLIAYSIADTVARNIEKMRELGVTKN
jgi:hypothetical protein